MGLKAGNAWYIISWIQAIVSGMVMTPSFSNCCSQLMIFFFVTTGGVRFQCVICVVVAEQSGDLGMVFGLVEYHCTSPLVCQKNNIYCIFILSWNSGI